MKLRLIHFFTAALLTLCALPATALIVLGGDAGHTVAPPDDPGWDNIGYVRSSWSVNTSRASGVYIGDGWVLTAYHVIYYDAPDGIVFNAEPNKEYPIDVRSYVRLNTNSFTRFADSPDWRDPEEFISETGWTSTEWSSILTKIAPEGADLALFRLTENPDIEPVYISGIPANLLSIYINGGWYIEENTVKYRPGNPEVTAIATGRPRKENLSYWTTNLNAWVVGNDGPLTNAPYSGYYDWDSVDYSPICRWGKNHLHASRTTVPRPPFGSTVCLPTVFNDYDSGGNSNTFQMARLDSGGGVFYKGTGQWELLGLLTAKALPNGTIATKETNLHPFGSYSLICDLSYYREQIMKVTEWPDLSIQLSAGTNTWLKIGQEPELSIITTNNSTNAVPQAFTNTVQVIKNGEPNETIHLMIPALAAGASFTNYPFTPDSPGTWKVIVTADSNGQIDEINEQNNAAFKTFYAGPDLLIVSSSPATTNAATGSAVSVEIAVQNQGLDDITNAFIISLYLVRSDWGGTDTPIQGASQSGLSAGQTVTNVFTFNAPSAPGIYYLIAKADDYDSALGGWGAVEESNEYNNESDDLSLLNVGPDLSISFIETNALHAMAGTIVNAYVDIFNTGASSAENVTSILQLSTNSVFETFSTLATNTTAIGTTSFKFRAPRDPGIYYLRAETDPADQVLEFDENNNTGNIITLEVSPLAMPWLNLLLND